MKRIDEERSDTATNPIGAALGGPMPLWQPPLARGFAATLMALSLVQPLPRVWATTLLFGLLRTVATPLIVFRETNLDDEDVVAQWQIDATLLVLSFFSVILLIPSNWMFNTGDDNASAIVATVVTTVTIVAATWIQRRLVDPIVTEEQLSEPEKELNTWDEQFRRLQQKQQDNSDS